VYRCQEIAPPFPRGTSAQEALRAMLAATVSEDELYARSNEIEPKMRV
jgi:hypothetical protein